MNSSTTLPARVGAQASRLTCIFSITLVFLAGVVTGGLAMNFGFHKWMHRTAPFWTEAGKEISLQKWKKSLSLTPAQTKELETILDDFGLYYHNVLRDGKAQIRKILTEEQQRKFDKLLDEQR